MHADMFGNCNVLTCYGGSSLFFWVNAVHDVARDLYELIYS